MGRKKERITRTDLDFFGRFYNLGAEKLSKKREKREEGKEGRGRNEGLS